MGNAGVTKSYKGVQRLPCSFARVEAVVDFMCPRSHLNRTDEIGVDLHLCIEAREQRWKMIADEMGLRSCRRVEGGQRKAADILYNLVRDSKSNQSKRRTKSLS